MGQVLLVRHGQASFGTDDYDVLSALGEQQAVAVGRALAGLTPALVLHGGLRRQRDTARIAAEAAGWEAPLHEDVRWDEFELAGTAERMAPGGDDRAAFQQWYEAATDRWLAGAHEPGHESRTAFEQRVTGALRDAAESGSPVVVFTSGGPVATLAAGLVDGGTAAYRRMMPTMVNTSITKIVSGRRGLSLVSWNGHEHLSPGEVSYR